MELDAAQALEFIKHLSILVSFVLNGWLLWEKVRDSHNQHYKRQLRIRKHRIRSQ